MMMMIGVIVCLLSCLYLYKENQKQRSEFLSFTQRMTSQVNQAPVREEKRKVVFKKKIEEVADEGDEVKSE